MDELDFQIEEISKLARVINGLKLKMPSVKVECLNAAGVSAVEMYLCGADNAGNYVEVHQGTLQPGETRFFTLSPVKENTERKTGETLILRTKGDSAIYKITNLEDHVFFLHTMTPPVFPWWKGTKAVKWGPDAPYLLYPGQVAFGLLLNAWEDVIYSWLIT